MTTQSEAVSKMIATLRVTDPELDTSTGSTTRKIIDMLGEQIAEGSIDNHLGAYQYDIDSKIGADLDDFVGLFGMARIAPRRASGIVTFVRGTSTEGNNAVVFIPVNTQIVSATSPGVTFQTVTGAYMEFGVTSVEVAVQAVEAGSLGNVPANTLTAMSSPLGGVGTSTNMRPMTGGSDQESDETLRDRWKRTVFRNLAGTEQMYLGIGLDDPNCYVVNVVGPSKRRREQVQIISGIGQCTVDDSAYVYAEPVFVGPNLDAGDIRALGFDYIWNHEADPPRFSVLDANNMPNEALVEVDYEYLPKASRNDPTSAITNRVDIWVGGTRPQAATQSVIFRDSLVFTDPASSSNDGLARWRWARADGEHPAEDNILIPLAWGPIVTVPELISINGTAYGRASALHPFGTTDTTESGTEIHYFYQSVHRDDAFGYASTSPFGLEFYVGDPQDGLTPPNNAVFSIGGQQTSPYLFNRMIHDLQAAVDRWRLLGIDAKVHQAKERAFRVSLAIMYAPKANVPTVNSAIDTALATFMLNTGFQGRLQASDILQAVHAVPGVDNVRFMRGDDHPSWSSGTPNDFPVGVQLMVGDGQVKHSYVDEDGRTEDVRLGDDEVPVFYGSSILIKAENSFGLM